MNQKNLSNWLKGIMIGMAICGLALFIVVIPYLLEQKLQLIPNAEGWYWPWMVMFWILAVPCYAVLGFGWKLAVNIGKDNSFCEANAHFLKMCGVMAIVDCIVLVVGNLIYLILGMVIPSFVVISIFAIAFGVVFSIAAAALSHLVLKAAMLQEQSDLTI